MTELRTGTVHLLTVQIVCPYCQNAPGMRLHGTPNVFTARQYVEHTQAGRAFCTECGQDFSLPANPWTERDALRAALEDIATGEHRNPRFAEHCGCMTLYAREVLAEHAAAWAGRDAGGTDA